MSINYQFTDRGTIQVWCGDDWIEIRLPGGGGGVAAGPTPKAPDLSDPSTDPRPISVPDDAPGIGAEPPIPPGTMFIGMIGSRGRPPSLLMRTPVPPFGTDPARFRPSSLADLQAEIARDLHRPFFQHFGVQLVEVDVNRLAAPPQLTRVDIEQLLQDWGPRLDSAGLGAREEGE